MASSLQPKEVALSMLRPLNARINHRLSSRTWLAGAGLGLALAAGLSVPEAQAVPPSAQEFTIRYFYVNADNTRGQQLVTQDFKTQFNAARCQCGEKVRVLLQRRRGPTWDPGIMEIRAGRQCDRGAQLNNGGAANYRPCLLLERLTNPQGAFLTDIEFDIPLYWFSSGLRDVNHELLKDPLARPFQLCPEITGSPGIWMCFGQDACQEGNFFFKPSAAAPSNQAGVGTSTKPATKTTVNNPLLDLVPPDRGPANLIPQVNPGDGSVQLTWDLPSDANVVGYRVLCRPADAAQAAWRHPEGLRVIKTFPGDRERFKNGTIYQLPREEYLGVQCRLPEGLTLDQAGANARIRPGQAKKNKFTAWQSSTASSTSQSSATSTAQDSTQTSSLTTGSSTETNNSTGTGTNNSTGTGSTPGAIDPAFASMDWGYICTEHLPGSSRVARVDGLTNGVNYRFQLIAYDLAGNPALVGNTASGVPAATIDYWDACTEGNTARCGKLGFCAVSEQSAIHPLWSLLLLAIGFRFRKDKSCS